MSKKSRRTRLYVTDRALADIAAIESYSVSQWGQDVADRYISDIESAFDRIRKKPTLLRNVFGFHASFRCYAVNRHVITCDVREATVIVLTVLHGSMDIPERLSELQPTLSVEIELLHQKLGQRERRRGDEQKS